MGADIINEQEDVFLQRRNFTRKQELIDKLIPLFNEFKTCFETSRDIKYEVEDKHQDADQFFNEWLDFFISKIEFFENPENSCYLTEYGEKYKKLIIEHLTYYKELFVAIKNKVEALDFISDIALLQTAERDLDDYVSSFYAYFRTFVDNGLAYPFLKKEYLEPIVRKENSMGEAKAGSEKISNVNSGDAEREVCPDPDVPRAIVQDNETSLDEIVKKPCIFDDDIHKQIENALNEYKKYLEGYNLENQSSRSSFLLVTKRSAVGNLLFALKNSTVDNFKTYLSDWKSTFALHRDNSFIQAIGSFFKRHTRTKGDLLVDKLENLIAQAEITINPQSNL